MCKHTPQPDAPHAPRLVAPAIAGLREELQAAGLAILPEAGAVYLVLASEVPDSFRCGGMAYSGENLDIALRPYISDWRGRGVALFLDDVITQEHILRQCEARPGAPPDYLLRRDVAGYLAHELAHVIREKWIPAPAEPGPPEAIAQRGFQGWCLRAQPQAEFCTTPWLSHDLHFLRVMLHAVYRLRLQLGWSFAAQSDHELYALSGLWAYEGALGAEPERRRHLPLVAISQTEPPAALVDLWLADLRRWYLALESASDFQTAAFMDAVTMFSPKIRRGFEMAELLKTIGEKFGALRRKRVADYRELVQSVAEGKQVNPDEATALLDAAGKSPEQLEADVASHQHRVELRATIDGLPALDSEEKAIRKKINAANAALERAEQVHTETVNPLDDRLEKIATARDAAARAVAELQKTARPELAAELAEVTEKIGAVATASMAGQLAARECERNLRRLLDEQGEQKHRDPMAVLGVVAREHKAAEAKLARAIAEQRETAARLDTEVTTLEGERRELLDRQAAVVRLQEAV